MRRAAASDESQEMAVGVASVVLVVFMQKKKYDQLISGDINLTAYRPQKILQKIIYNWRVVLNLWNAELAKIP